MRIPRNERALLGSGPGQRVRLPVDCRGRHSESQDNLRHTCSFRFSGRTV